MRILHLISQTPDFTGSGKFIQQIITRSRGRGYENFLVAGCQGDFTLDPGLTAPDHTLLVRFDHQDLPFAVAGMSDAMPYESTVFSCMSSEKLSAYRKVFKAAITRALERFKPDLIHSHHLWILSALAQEVIKEQAMALPMVTTCHGTCLRQHILCPHISEAVTPHLKGIDRVMALNPSQQEEIMSRFGFFPDQVPVITGGYDDSLFTPGDKPEDRVELVYAGKLCRAKGVPWLLKSLRHLDMRDVRLHLAGGGAGREKDLCLDLARDLGDRVRIHGPLSHQDLAALMGRSHLFILPSFFEGVPLVLMEALACGCRVLTTDLPGVREILSDRDNPMVRLIPLPPLETIDAPYKKDEPGLEKILAGRLSQLIDQIKACPGPDLEAAACLTRLYSWEKVFGRIEYVYHGAFNS